MVISFTSSPLNNTPEVFSQYNLDSNTAMLIDRIPVLTRLDNYPRTNLLAIWLGTNHTKERPAIDFWPAPELTRTRILEGFTIPVQHSEQGRYKNRFWAVELWKTQFICGMSSGQFEYNVAHAFTFRLPGQYAIIVETCGSLDAGGQPIIS
ncbi:MAG TPA: hypothetical protein VKO18_13290 [Terriglobia bacterium]|nr:hypothetical protein [Terriglobia bacterium]